MRWVLVGSIPVNAKTAAILHWWLMRVDTKKERDWDEDPKTCFRLSCRVAFVKLSWLLKPKPNSNASHFRSSLYTEVVLFFFVFFQNIFIFYHARSVDFKEKIEGL